MFGPGVCMFILILFPRHFPGRPSPSPPVVLLTRFRRGVKSRPPGLPPVGLPLQPGLNRLRPFSSPLGSLSYPLSGQDAPRLGPSAVISSPDTSRHIPVREPWWFSFLFNHFVSFLAVLQGMWDLSRLTKDQTHTALEALVLTAGLPGKLLNSF